jgi:hypothetical protein
VIESTANRGTDVDGDLAPPPAPPAPKPHGKIAQVRRGREFEADHGRGQLGTVAAATADPDQRGGSKVSHAGAEHAVPRPGLIAFRHAAPLPSRAVDHSEGSSAPHGGGCGDLLCGSFSGPLRTHAGGLSRLPSAGRGPDDRGCGGSTSARCVLRSVRSRPRARQTASRLICLWSSFQPASC